MDETFRVLLREARRKAILKAKGPAKIPTVPTAWKYPTLLERKYSNYLVRLISRMTKVGVDWVKTEYPAALEAYRPTTDGLVLDASSHELTYRLSRSLDAEQYTLGLEPGEQVETEVAGIADAVQEWNRKRWSWEYRIMLGDVYQLQEPWMQATLAEWTETNRKLVKSLTGEALSRMESLALEALQKGTRHEDLTVEVLKLGVKNVNRAKLIARDQLGKLNALVNEKRSLDCGMDRYVWETAMDERVRGNPAGKYPTARPRHDTCQGKIGIYGKPGVWFDEATGKTVPRLASEPSEPVGFAVQCRCVGSSRWKDVVAPIDEDLMADPYIRAELGLP